MTEATKGSCSDPIGLKEKIGPSECQTMASEPHAGRMLFRGVDMVFLMVNGHEMLTLHDILEKLLPTTSRSTFCVRIKKMNALRYACKRLEIRKIKALGGAKRSAIKCTVIAREHIEEYCEKYKSRGKFPREAEGNVKSCLENQQGYTGKCSSIRNRFCRINSGVAEDGSVSVNNDERGLECRNDNANEGDEENITGNDGNVIREISQIETKVSGNKENGKSKKQNVCSKKRNIRQSAKRSNSVSWSSAGAISQQKQTEGKMDQQGSQLAAKPCRVLKRRVTTSGIGESARKRKPKTKSKQVQTRCDEIADDNDIHKRQKTSCYLNGNGRAAANIKGHQASIDRDSSSASLKRSLAPSLTLDLSEFTPSTERSRDQIFQAFNNEVFNDESNANGETAKCYLDINNNSSEIEVPRSPTLLLKRTVNNGWQVAKNCLPRLDFDGDEVNLLSGDEAAETNHVHLASSTDPNIYNATVPTPKAVINPSIKTGTQTNKSSTSTLKKSVAVGQRILRKKNDRIMGGKTKAFKTAEQELTKPNGVNRFVFTKDINSGANVIGNDCGDGVKSSESNSSISSLNGTRKDTAETRGNVAKDKSNNGSVQKAKTTNKALNGAVAVKPKRRRRIQLNTFRLIETIPYSSLLVVKDGDLCPSHTMAYSDAKDLPHCFHALWRWRLGKPVSVHPKGTAQVGRTSSGEPQRDQENCVNTVKGDARIGVEIDEIFTGKLSMMGGPAEV